MSYSTQFSSDGLRKYAKSYKSLAFDFQSLLNKVEGNNNYLAAFDSQGLKNSYGDLYTYKKHIQLFIFYLEDESKQLESYARELESRGQ